MEYKDRLNMEYITNVIDDQDCVFDIEKENVLTTLTKTSLDDTYQISLGLLNSRKQLNNNDNRQIGNGSKYKYEYVFLLIIILLALIGMCIVIRKYYKKQIRSSRSGATTNEESPLLV